MNDEADPCLQTPVGKASSERAPQGTHTQLGKSCRIAPGGRWFMAPALAVRLYCGCTPARRYNYSTQLLTPAKALPDARG